MRRRLGPRDPDREQQQGDREGEDAVAEGLSARDINVVAASSLRTACQLGISLKVAERAAGLSVLLTMLRA